jgi:hypothetical protein
LQSREVVDGVTGSVARGRKCRRQPEKARLRCCVTFRPESRRRIPHIQSDFEESEAKQFKLSNYDSNAEQLEAKNKPNDGSKENKRKLQNSKC